MRPQIVWVWRGSGRLLGPILLGFLLFSLFTQPTWQVELDWATRLTAATVVMVSPVVAAAAAFDTAIRWRPTVALLSRSSVRGPWQITLPAMAVVAWAVGGYVLTWVVSAVVVAVRGGIGVTDWWVFAEVIAPLVGAGAAGLLAGMVIGSRLAPLAAAAGVLGTLVLAAPWGRGPFEAVTTYGTLTGLERPSIRAAAVVIGVLVLALSAFVAAAELNRPRGARRPVLGLCVSVLIGAAIAPAAWPWKVDVFGFTAETYGCVGAAPVVCGPRSRLPLLGPVQVSLAEAYRELSGTVFTEPRSFRVTRLDQYSQLDGAAPLDFDPGDIIGGRYSDDAVARALVRPHQCTELFEASSAVPLLEAQDVVVPWLRQVLAGTTSATPVPPEVSSAFARIENCRPMTWNLR